MVGWDHQLNGHEFEQTLGNDEGRGSLVPGSSPSRIQGNPQDERHRRERETCRTGLDGAKSAGREGERERGREEERERMCDGGAACLCDYACECVCKKSLTGC